MKINIISKTKLFQHEKIQQVDRKKFSIDTKNIRNNDKTKIQIVDDVQNNSKKN